VVIVIHCHNCGKRLLETSKFCSECGTGIASPEPKKSEYESMVEKNLENLRSGLTPVQKEYLEKKAKKYKVTSAVAGVGGGLNYGVGIALIIVGILLCFTLIGAIIGIPMIIIGVITKSLGKKAGKLEEESRNKVEEIEDRLHGLK
jgi:ribosomal protein L37E